MSAISACNFNCQCIESVAYCTVDASVWELKLEYDTTRQVLFFVYLWILGHLFVDLRILGHLFVHL